MRRCLGRLNRLGPSERSQWLPPRQLGRPWPRDFTESLRRHTDDIKFPQLLPTSWTSDQPEPQYPDTADPAAWVKLLDHALPLHLREVEDNANGTALSIGDVTQLLSAFRNRPVVVDGGSTGAALDLLYHLGVHQNRWQAVVWLMKQIVDAYAPLWLSSRRLAQSLLSWTSRTPLRELTQECIDVKAVFSPSALPGDLSSDGLQDLEAQTDGRGPQTLSREQVFWHEALGSVWQSIGMITISYASREIPADVLEIIAHLHHTELMPASIYNHSIPLDSTAIQQPLVLSLLSFRILDSLSDAAARAHVEAIAGRSGVKRGQRIALPYQGGVAGLRPELWLELVLWSCLHGGWIREGANIMHVVHAEPPERLWKPLSWDSLAHHAQQHDDWSRLEYAFDTQKQSTLENSQSLVPISVKRTVSSEIVNAYVDALVSEVRLGVGDRGIAPKQVMSRLRQFQNFLRRSDLNLATGTWDAIMIRVFDAIPSPLSSRWLTLAMAKLSRGMGDESQSNNSHALPAYIFDGSAAVLGLHHQALRSSIKAGDKGSVLALFASLKGLADKNKERSIRDFIDKQNSNPEDYKPLPKGEAGIEYPAFDVQMSSEDLGSFIELLLNAKDYDLIKALLHSDDIDGPFLGQARYADSPITNALIRFATVTNDKALLSKLVQARSSRTNYSTPTLQHDVLQSFLRSQVTLGRWDSAQLILEQMKDTKDVWPSPGNVAHVLKKMLMLDGRDAETGDPASLEQFGRAKDLLSSMLDHEFDQTDARPASVTKEIDILVTILSTLSSEWAKFALTLRDLPRSRSGSLTAGALNDMMEGIVYGLGSVAGRRTLGIFWSHEVREAQKLGYRWGIDNAGEPRMEAMEPSILNRPDRTRTVVRLPGQLDQEVATYLDLRPNITTFLIILRKASEELKQAPSLPDRPAEDSGTSIPVNALAPADAQEFDTSPIATINWAIRRLRWQQLSSDEIRAELRQAFTHDELEQMRPLLPDLLHQHEFREADVDTHVDGTRT